MVAWEGIMYKRILIINLMYIGDLLFTTPLVRMLRANFSDAHIAMLADRKNAEVIKYNPNLSEVIAIDKKGHHNKIGNYIRLISKLREQNYDLVINLHPNERASALAAFSGGKRIIGFSARGFHCFFDQTIKEPADIHQADAYLEVLKLLGSLKVRHNGLEMRVDEASRHSAERLWDEYLQAANPEKKPDWQVVAMNTGGSWPTKRWTKSGFAKVADQLLQAGYGVAFFGGPMDEADVQQVTELMQERENKKLVCFTGRTTLLEMADLVRRCQVLVSGDSGPMHIAVSQKVPVISLFGPSDPVRYAPYGQKDGVLRSEEACLGCGQHHCEHHRCMEGITPQRVYVAVMRILTEPE